LAQKLVWHRNRLRRSYVQAALASLHASPLVAITLLVLALCGHTICGTAHRSAAKLAPSINAHAKYLLPHLELSPFLLIIRSALGLYRAAVTGKVAGISKTVNVPYFHRDVIPRFFPLGKGSPAWHSRAARAPKQHHLLYLLNTSLSCSMCWICIQR